MTILTIEIPDKETKVVTTFIKKIGVKVTDSQPGCDFESPDSAEIKASENTREGTYTSYKSAEGTVESIEKHQKNIRVKKQLLTGLETGLKQAKKIQSNKSKGFSISEIVNGK